jgi:hypothetical protein
VSDRIHPTISRGPSFGQGCPKKGKIHIDFPRVYNNSGLWLLQGTCEHTTLTDNILFAAV